MPKADPQRFKALIKPHLDALFRAAYRLTRNRADAEDLVQEACVRGYLRLDDLREHQPKAWLLRVLHNAFVDTARRLKSSPIRGGDSDTLERSFASLDCGPEESAYTAQREEHLQRAWLSLDRGQRALLALRAEGYTLDEIANITGLAMDALTMRLYRVSALMKLMSGLIPVPEAHDTAVVAAAFEIAAKSSDPDARASAWLWIGRLGVEPPQVLPALLSALERDSADEVRSTAARVLADFLHEPGVAEALARAAAEDPQERPAAACCLLTVREAARRALLADEEPRAAVRKILFDESLPPHDRLMLVAANGRFFSLRELGDDAAQAVFGIGANAADPDIRGTAWYWLRGAHSARFAPTLLDDLARHSSEQVRAQAAAALTSYSDDPAVSAALARALRDPAESVQRAAREALERTPP